MRRVFGDAPPESAPQGQATAAAQENADIPTQAGADHHAQSEQTDLAQTERTDCHNDGQSAAACLPVTDEDQEQEIRDHDGADNDHRIQERNIAPDLDQALGQSKA